MHMLMFWVLVKFSLIVCLRHALQVMAWRGALRNRQHYPQSFASLVKV